MPKTLGSAHFHRPLQPRTDEEWVVQIREGSYSAFEELFQTHYAGLCGFARTCVGRHEVAEELVQDLFFNIWQQRDRWYVRGNLRAYLYSAVRKNAAKYARRQAVERRWRLQSLNAPPERSTGPEELLRAKELEAAVKGAIEKMPEKRRRIYKLARNHQMAYAEIAAVLGISVNTVKVQMSRALKHLRNAASPFLSVFL